ncbi:MAG TPA: hypothetical protein VMT34_10870 [Aggregatilineales bacterium]|nr:hypothetical protein [Aggregatilineales bacterium]
MSLPPTPTRRIWWHRLRTRLILGLIALGFTISVPSGTPAQNGLEDRVVGRARDVLFNYVGWESDALTGKIVQHQAGVAPYLSEADRSRYVHDYLKQVGRLQSIEGQIAGIYGNPAITNPAAASADLRAQRDQIKAQTDSQQPLAESIIESQVASVLRDEGFATLGQVLPPVSAHLTQLPMLLVISPRDQIRFAADVTVINLPGDQREALENRIEQDLNVSSLIVPLGGLSLYPSMVMQTYFTPFVFNTVAHEWTHHYLYFFPLGWEYNSSPETRTINETTASLLGDEVSRKVLAKFYQDFPDVLAQIPPPIGPTTSPSARATPTPTPDPRLDDVQPSFDFSRELNTTRRVVDLYLHFGMVDQAEAYMRAERYVFAANGYPDRINQAYFAFYGGYLVQSVGASAGGTDPIGPAILTVRAHSRSLKDWLETMRTITNRSQLLAERDALAK